MHDGQAFIDMLETRNALSHTYDESTFQNGFLEIKTHYFPAFSALRDYLSGEVQNVWLER
ncbi:MAG: nucleotidyltransferase substrate binding protein [Cellulomonadaceae bacterium]|nr:nucleotidyltransferase substrate binding protein [Cellulomonadaceae bacterium]